MVLAAAIAGAACDGSANGPTTHADPSSPAPRSAGSDGGSARQGEGRCGDAPAYPKPPRDRPRYELDIDVRPDAGVVFGRLKVAFTPDIDTDRIVFRLWPNGPHHMANGALLATESPTLGGRRARQVRRPDPTTLVVRPSGGEIAAGDTLRIAMRWQLELPTPSIDRISARGDAVTLGSFFPLLPWIPGEGWATDPPTTILGETSVSPTADFDVTISTPPGTSVLATGVEREPGRWRARAVRDFAVAVGSFEIARGVAMAPDDPVRVTVGVEDDVDASPTEFRDEVIFSLEELAARYGPYAWPTLNMAIMPDLDGAGVEYPTMIFQGEDSLERATTHEVAHMWFYSLVGSNPARSPWLDEGVTTYTSSVVDGDVPFFERFDIPVAVQDKLGNPMTFWEGHERDYFEGVYAQGVQAMAALGPEHLVDCALASYVARNAYGVAEPRDLFRALTRVLPDARSVLRRFGV